ncbi:hypothetical protein Hanom_Chr07g00650901 [Helianthus anomalus]
MCLMFKASCKTTYRVGVSSEVASVFLWGRRKAVNVLPSSDHTLAWLLVGFNDDDDITPIKLKYFPKW